MGKGKERLGDLLLDAGLVTFDELEDALAQQHLMGGRLGEILVSQLLVTEDQIADLLARQKGLPHVNLTSVGVDPFAAALVPLRLAQRLHVIPIAIENGDRLILAMADPLDIQAMDEVEFATHLHVDPVVASSTQIRYAIEKYVAGADALHELRAEEEAAEEPPTPGVVQGDSDVAVVRIVNQLIREAVSERASDIHIEPRAHDVRIRYRVDGVLREAAIIPKASQAELVSRVKVMADLDITERRRPQDGRIPLSVDDRQLDLRVATLPTPLGEMITLRILDNSMAFHSLEEIGLAGEDLDKVLGMLARPFGALLISGPTGSGKSTTLYALLSRVNDVGRKIITVEDPIEYRMDGVTQMAVNMRVGLTFASGLRTILRSDPDVIMVGEVRDPETAEMAVRSALTGHLVLSSIHTNDAPSALTRITDMGVPPYITSSAIAGAVAQRLARRLCPVCKVHDDVKWDSLVAAGFTEEEALGAELYKAVGCDECAGTGYRGRVGLFEVMELDSELQRRFIARAPSEVLRSIAIEHGMRPLRRDGLDKVKAGITSLDELNRVVV